jgi:hypothetical protein
VLSTAAAAEEPESSVTTEDTEDTEEESCVAGFNLRVLRGKHLKLPVTDVIISP